MEIKILGTRGEIKAELPRYSRHSGILIDGKLLLDIGEKEFLKYKPSWIFVTHLHPDHAFFVNEKVKIDIPIFAPEKFGNALETQVASRTIKVGNYQINPIPTVHSIKVKSQGYLIQSKSKTKYKRLLYTGDLITINKNYYNLLGNLDLVITEGSFIRKGGMIRKDKKSGLPYGHAGIPDLIKLFKPFTKTFIFTHFGSWFFQDPEKAKKKLEDLGRINKVRIIIGSDGLVEPQ